MINKRDLKTVRVPAAKKVRLSRYATEWTPPRELKALSRAKLKARARDMLRESLDDLRKMQELLYADNRYAVLIVLQAMDAAGKDGMIEHVMSGVNPQGCQVFSFKEPSAEELDHTFLWRCMTRAPERGRIGIFNRSYYEDVLVVRVHPELLEPQRLGDQEFDGRFWRERFEDINAFEQHLVRNGTIVLKFFLHLSKEQQKRRFLDRLDEPDKHWKFSAADVTERSFWDDYQHAYEQAFSHTSTEWAPWHIIPADHKWVARAMVANIIASSMAALDLRFPTMTAGAREAMAAARKQLEGDD